MIGTSQQLQQAIASAKGGETFDLAPGSYGTVSFNTRQFAKPVTFRSVDPANPAVFNRLLMLNSQGVTFADIDICRIRQPGEADWTKMAELDGCSDIAFLRGSVHGTLNGQPQDDMHGLYVRRSNRFKAVGTRFTELNVALTMDDCTAVTVQNCDFSIIGTDAIDLPGVVGAQIIGNRFHDFRPNDGAHPDAIQCWTRGKKSGAKNVTILRNRFEGAPGYEFQGVFFGDEDRVGGYDDITIESNVFSCTMWHAINIDGPGARRALRFNTITAGPNYKPWIRTVGPVDMQGNSAPDYIQGAAHAVPAGNAVAGLFKA